MSEIRTYELSSDGTPRVHVATAYTEDDPVRRRLVIHEAEGGVIGEIEPKFNGLGLDKLKRPTEIVFYRKESVQVMIDTLEEIKANIAADVGPGSEYQREAEENGRKALSREGEP